MRKDIHLYYLEIAKLVGSRSTCDRGYTGCVITKDKQILSTGYAGSPSGLPHCDEIGHEMKNDHCIRTTHSEINAICQAAKNGVSINNGTLYCTMTPCYACAKAIINVGIKNIYVEYDYHASKKTKKLFQEAGIPLYLSNNKVKEYEGVQHDTTKSRDVDGTTRVS